MFLMSAYLAGAVTTAAAGASISVLTNIVSLITTVKKLTAYEEVKEAVDDLDINATVSTIEMVCKIHYDGGEDYKTARRYVMSALDRVKFDLETIHVKTRLHKEGYISRFRYLDLSREKKKLSKSMKILRSRFHMMWTLSRDQYAVIR